MKGRVGVDYTGAPVDTHSWRGTTCTVYAGDVEPTSRLLFSLFGPDPGSLKCSGVVFDPRSLWSSQIPLDIKIQFIQIFFPGFGVPDPTPSVPSETCLTLFRSLLVSPVGRIVPGRCVSGSPYSVWLIPGTSTLILHPGEGQSKVRQISELEDVVLGLYLLSRFNSQTGSCPRSQGVGSCVSPRGPRRDLWTSSFQTWISKSVTPKSRKLTVLLVLQSAPPSCVGVTSSALLSSLPLRVPSSPMTLERREEVGREEGVS